jgi:CheY-like chemotaxis protein
MRETAVVLDDNQLTRMLVSDALLELGFEPHPYASAQEAMARMEIDPPKVCIVDYLMPNINGAEFIHTLRRSPDPRLKSLPVIGLSSDYGQELLAAGANACLKKPFSQAALAQALKDALSGGAAAHQVEPSSPRWQRRTPRVIAELEMEIHWALGITRTRTIDISTTGFSIRSAHDLPVGVVVTFSFAARDVRGKARVVRSATLEPGVWRLGFQFEEMTPSERNCAESLVVDTVLGNIIESR